ncbi:hypothetical protein [Natronobacterium gregoryi]|uniref:Uncharacterized protein n=2 Tax=Natronobacterium gregoryi TaxID=44930 RepID=L0AL28_NATGS|nr:hypothetical protein [Natronobacterium gregoryi]AFZ73897.1 hypothetical protein Natgr_2752 [Natronobacterium gregoryi SP2]ELY64853.1 hypothetical protein C490_14245 [Natronobacterium gregoryi SP2]PLK19146.1 hypothetical protein CYV19_16360 [Natronobacterium gregoryi SP2]SFJ59683.1 hypothetical protein SAMN05443661_14418 [Natronobacterium gregoryi]
MLALTLEEFMIELNDGSIKNVGPKNKAATAKLFDVETVEAREFGDKRVKLVFEDEDDNEIQVSLFPEDVRKLTNDVEELEEESPVFE